MSETCEHLERLTGTDFPEPTHAWGVRGMPPRGHALGGASRVPYVRPCRLLRFICRQARDAALPRNGPPGHALGDAWA